MVTKFTVGVKSVLPISLTYKLQAKVINKQTLYM